MLRGLDTRFFFGVLTIILLIAGFILLTSRDIAPPSEETGGTLSESIVPVGMSSSTQGLGGATLKPESGKNPSAAGVPAKKPSAPQTSAPISFTAPRTGDELVISEAFIVRWSRGSIQTGGLSLLDATTKQTVGWLLSMIDRNQASYQWDARSVYLSRGNPLLKDILPGTYVLRLAFDGPERAAESAPFSIVYPSQVKVDTHQVTIQNLSFTPGKLTVKQGDRVVFTNGDTVNHTLKLSVSYPPQTLAPGGSFVLSTLSLSAGQYEVYSEQYPTAKTLLSIQ